VLEERIRQGPLTAVHLSAAQALTKTEETERTEQSAGVKALQARHDALDAAPDDRQVQQPERVLYLNDLDTQCAEIVVVESDSTTASPTGAGVTGHRHEPSLFKNLMLGPEKPSSLLSKREKAALELIELRAKTARIQKNLPDWVKNGLVPPWKNLSSSATTLGQQAIGRTQGSQLRSRPRDALHISCDVRADIGFLSDFLKQAPKAKPQPDLIERQLFGEERLSEVSNSLDLHSGLQEAAALYPDEGLAVAEQHSTEGEIASSGHGLQGLPPQPPAQRPSLLARLFSALVHFLSSCTEALLSVCRWGLSSRT
jgi:hypothetical protein